MKKIYRKTIAAILLTVIFCSWLTVTANALFPTSYTMTPTAEGEGFAITQNAYQIVELYRELGLQEAEDMAVSGNTAYIADTGNHRIVVLDLLSGDFYTVGEGLLNRPTGVAVDKDGRIYVADYTNCEAYRFSASGQLEQVFSKPDTPKFGVSSQFIPRKVAPAKDGGVYLIVEGAAGGIVYMDPNGGFVGYYAANLTEADPIREFLEKFLTEEQLSSYMKKTPDSFGNLMVDAEDLLYTVNLGEEVQVLKHSLNGTGIHAMTQKQKWISNVTDIALDANGNIFALDAEGHIIEMTADGIWLCVFGAQVTSDDRLGLFQTPSGLGLDDAGNLYVLDKTRSTIQKFTPTASQRQIHSAIAAYNQGDYDTAMAQFSQILQTNESSYYAHFYMGRMEMYNQNYYAAAAHFKIACAREDYSQAFWEIRNQWVQKHMIYVVAVVVILGIALYVYTGWKRRNRYEEEGETLPAEGRFQRFCQDFAWLKTQMRHPIDNAYEIDVGHRGNITTSTCIYVLVFLLFVVYRLCSGFLFSAQAEDFPLLVYLGSYGATLALFVVGNTLIASIQGGESSFKTIYIAVSYCFAPLLMAFPMITVLNNLFTYNEQFICQMLLIVAVGWSVVNLSVSLIRIHDFSFKKFLKNLFLTIVFMLVAILLISLFYLLAKQMVDFVKQVYTEVMIRE